MIILRVKLKCYYFTKIVIILRIFKKRSVSDFDNSGIKENFLSGKEDLFDLFGRNWNYDS